MLMDLLIELVRLKPGVLIFRQARFSELIRTDYNFPYIVLQLISCVESKFSIITAQSFLRRRLHRKGCFDQFSRTPPGSFCTRSIQNLYLVIRFPNGHQPLHLQRQLPSIRDLEMFVPVHFIVIQSSDYLSLLCKGYTYELFYTNYKLLKHVNF